MPDVLQPGIVIERPAPQGGIASDVDQQVEEIVASQYEPIPPRPWVVDMILMNLEAIRAYKATPLKWGAAQPLVRFHKKHPNFMMIVGFVAGAPTTAASVIILFKEFPEILATIVILPIGFALIDRGIKWLRNRRLINMLKHQAIHQRVHHV